MMAEKENLTLQTVWHFIQRLSLTDIQWLHDNLAQILKKRLSSSYITVESALNKYQNGNYCLARVANNNGQRRWHIVNLDNDSKVPLWLEHDEKTLQVDPWDDEQSPMLHRDLNRRLPKLSSAVRWQIATDLYTTDAISSGRAAEISGLGYIMWMEKLREEGIPFNEAVSITPEQKARSQALIYAITNIKP
ncbi:MAG: hypothetical protein B6242_11595 [Anaerolineaceae bacterium 4572_78]|nr:MAG: hypothetical protein B6242_11595 [Anaerolineaceae bacterium 4572_78]